MEVGAHIIVRGFVQGVGFRYFVYQRATRFDLKGSVRNLYNGDVEIEVEGDRSMIEEFLNELKVGPRVAHVADVLLTWTSADKNFRRFDIH